MCFRPCRLAGLPGLSILSRNLARSFSDRRYRLRSGVRNAGLFYAGLFLTIGVTSVSASLMGDIERPVGESIEESRQRGWTQFDYHFRDGLGNRPRNRRWRFLLGLFFLANAAGFGIARFAGFGIINLVAAIGNLVFGSYVVITVASAKAEAA